MNRYSSNYWKFRYIQFCLVIQPILCGAFLDSSLLRQYRSVTIVSSSRLHEKKSRILSIESFNLAGKSSPAGDTIRFDFPEKDDARPGFTCITGETGTGKSLLSIQAVELLKKKSCGSHLVPEGDAAAAQVTLRLDPGGVHLQYIRETLEAFHVKHIQNTLLDGHLIKLRRTLVRQKGQKRVKSVSQINNHTVPFACLQAIADPLLVTVDATAASAAFSQPLARRAIIDGGIDGRLRKKLLKAQRNHHAAIIRRQSIEQELRYDNLPRNMSPDMVYHWIEELDSFSKRVEKLIARAVLENEPNKSMDYLLLELSNSHWMDNDNLESPNVFFSTIYRILMDIKKEMKALDDRILACQEALHTLCSLSAPDSAAVAIERTRNLLLGAVDTENSKLSEESERAHELLNSAESLLVELSRVLEDDRKGLLGILNKERNCYPISLNEIDSILSEWNTISRKHGIIPSVLPSCHQSMIHELSGSTQLQKQLDFARSSEENYKAELVVTADEALQERRKVAMSLSRSVTRYMSTLGMARSAFYVDIERGYIIGEDDVKFMLQHGSSAEDLKGKIGQLHEIASTGEKSRILLAIETSICGSLGVSSRGSFVTDVPDPSLAGIQVLPIAILYDEIDAHVGGKAAKGVADMLVSQAATLQVLAITHSASIAAAADLHIRVTPDSRSADSLIVQLLGRSDRRKELARMASGDVAIQEAERLAEALMREISSHNHNDA